MPREKKKSDKDETLALDLALQGGGSHGAFTWGVLDALMEGGVCSFPGISGTSAGAMNAAVLASGFAKAAAMEISDPVEAQQQGCAYAREALRSFWEAVGTMGLFVTAAPTNLAAQWMPWLKPFLASPLSPAQMNPMDINPLRIVLRQMVDFEQLNAYQGKGLVPKLFICATNVRTGRSKIFENEAVSLDALLASACLPHMFNAVEIDGEHYWDGGFSGNPAIYPLIYRTKAADVLLVQINPIEITSLPRSVTEIQERVNEVTFNAGLLSEMRAIEFVKRLLDEGRLDEERYRSINLHRVDGGAFLETFGSDSKTRSDISFIQKLFAKGRESGQQWLEQHRSDIGVRSTLD